MAANSSATQQSSGNSGLTVILTAIQNGATALNNTTRAISLIFPSSS